MLYLKKIKEFLKQILLFQFLKLKYRKNAHPKIFEWNWDKKNFNRIAVVNFLIAKTGGLTSKYLEIGCQSNTLFNSVASIKKSGVDPVSGGTHQMTSDDFFLSNKEKFNVIFIDGLHHYEQVRKDAINSLNSLEDGGWIAFHDFLPANWEEQHIPRLNSDWTGDCWKLAVELTYAQDLDFKIIKIDNGVGLLQKKSSNWFIPDLSKKLKTAGFEKFVENIEKMPLYSFYEALK